MSNALTADALKLALETGAREPKLFPLPDGGMGVVVPEGYNVEKLRPVNMPLPDSIFQNTTFHDADSFIEYVNRFKTGTAQVFAAPGFLNNGVAVIKAILDYHDKAKPGRAGHIATYGPRYSEQWTRWHKACSAPMRQVAFAEFIEEVRADIVEPTAASLLDIVRMFKANKQVEFDSHVYQSDGGVKLNYSEKVNQTGSSGVLPEQMLIGIPVYFRDIGYKITVLVRFKVEGGAVNFHLKLDRADIIEEAAFKTLVAKIDEATDIVSYLGKAAA